MARQSKPKRYKVDVSDIPVNRDGYVPLRHLREIEKGRSARARRADSRRVAKRVLPKRITPEQAAEWISYPGGCDIECIDAPCGTATEEVRRTQKTRRLPRRKAGGTARGNSWWKKLEEVTASWERTEYSPPDSTGKQYPTSVTTGSVNSSTQEERKDTSQTNTKIESLYAEITNIQRRMQQIEQEVSTVKAERKETLSWWQSALMFLGGIGFLIIILRLIWRKLP